MSNPYEVPASGASEPGPQPRRADPVLRAAWPEALVVFSIWGTAMAWTVGYCSLFAYPGRENLDQAARELTYVFGFPSWVFWGIILPWLCCVVASFFVSNFLMSDADLGIDPDEAMREIIGEDSDA